MNLPMTPEIIRMNCCQLGFHEWILCEKHSWHGIKRKFEKRGKVYTCLYCCVQSESFPIGPIPYDVSKDFGEEIE